MAQTLVYKILESHLADGTLEAGSPIGIRIDQTLTQDITGTMAMMEFEAHGLSAARPRPKSRSTMSTTT